MKRVLIIFAVLLLAAPFAVAKPQEMQVTADAEVRIKPNRVAITFGVSEKTESLEKGRDNMKSVIAKAMAFCKNIGIEDKYIQTESIYISPRYDNVYDPYKKNGKEYKEVLRYDLRQTFTVTLEDLSKYDTVLYSLLNMGINQVDNITFYSTDMKKYRDEARLKAIASAQDKAKLLTDAAGIKLGKAVNISESIISTPFYGARNAFSNVSQNMMQSYDSAADSGETALATGLIPVKAQVTITYNLK